jgi:hypothetical protein
VTGLGAGDYPLFYIRHRSNPDYITQPHSLPLQLLGELGLVGLVGLLAFAAAVLWAAVSSPADASWRDDFDLRVAGLGIFATWLAHTSVDWLHNIPGVTGAALVAAACLLARGRGVELKPPGRGGNAPAALAMAGALLVASSVGVQWLADRYRESARSALGRDVRAAIVGANRAIALNPERIDTYVVKSAAYAELGAYRQARQVLGVAIAKEPRNHVPWALLGDLALRRGDTESARRAYGRASRFNPYDAGLARLARSPESALEGDGR